MDVFPFVKAAYNRLMTKNTWRPLMAIVFGAFVLAALMQIAWPKKYTSSAVIMPVAASSDSTNARILQGLNLPLALGDFGGGGELVKFKELLATKRILGEVITKCDVLKDFGTTVDLAADRLSKTIDILVTKGGMLRVALTSTLDPDKTVCVLNQTVPVLNDYLETAGLNKARAKRTFLESQIEQKRKDIAQLSNQLSAFSEESKTVAVDLKLLKVIEAYSGLLSKKMGLDLKFQMLSRFQPEARALQEIKAEINRVDAEIQKLNIPDGFSKDSGFISLPFQKSPLLGLHYLRLKEELATTTNIVALLMQQLELTRLEEVENRNYFEMVDAAVVPADPSSPKFLMNFLMLMVIGFVAYVARPKVTKFLRLKSF